MGNSIQYYNHEIVLRLLKMARLIHSLSYVSTERFMKEFGISKRTVQRDIDRLRDIFDAPVGYDRLHDGYYFTDKEFFAGNMLFSEYDVVALAGILPLLERYGNTPLKDSVVKAYAVISKMLPDSVEVMSSLLNDVEFISDPLPAVEPDVFEGVFDAAERHCSISFGYRSISATSYAAYSCNPYKVFCQKGDWYVAGFDNKNERFCAFSLSRMKDVVPGKEFTPDADFEDKVRLDCNLGVVEDDSPAVRIELMFKKSVNTYILERTWHKAQKCKQNKDGSVLLTFESDQIKEVLCWILQFGGDVKVLNPPELKLMYKAELLKMQANCQ